MINQIIEMHKHFKISDVAFSLEEKQFRIAAMKEELQEYIDAINPEDELDALVDLIVFALGTVDRQGWSNVFDTAFNRVMVANMAKQVGPQQKRGSFALDLVKPEGWEPADLTDLVNKDIELPREADIVAVNKFMGLVKTKTDFSEILLKLLIKRDFTSAIAITKIYSGCNYGAETVILRKPIQLIIDALNHLHGPTAGIDILTALYQMVKTQLDQLHKHMTCIYNLTIKESN